ncbi:MAG: hypothetical protein AB7Y74_13950, partial [Syntrophorhabdus sp.]
MAGYFVGYSKVMFVGGLIGGKTALKLSNLWLRSIFLTFVVDLALRILFYVLFQRKNNLQSLPGIHDMNSWTEKHAV